jgi:hypothetical protein
MLDLDVKREERFGSEHSFKILGRVFTVKRGVKPETMLHWENLADELTGAEALEAMDGMVKRLLIPDDVPRWEEMRDEDGAENVDMTDLQELVPALISMATGRPFGSAASSGQASENPRTGMPSMDTSDTTPEPVLVTQTSEAL